MTAQANTFCPDGWLFKKTKYLFSALNGATPQSAESSYWDGEIYWATPEDIGKLSGKILADTRRKITEEGYKNCGTQLAPVGSIVLTTRAPVGNIAIAGVPLCTNQGCRTLVAKDESINTTFFYYQLLSHKEDLDMLASGTTFKELGADELKAFLVLEPPRDIQIAIVDYLDRETARIDSLIAAKERLLELLEEKRLALITHAVTRGLDPNAPMRDSGVPWIGGIPKHWQTLRVKVFAEIYYGLSQPPEYRTFGTPFIRATNVNQGKISTEGLEYVDELDLPGTRTIHLQAGDIIVVRSGAYTGDSALVTQDWNGAIAGYDMVMRIYPLALSPFVAYAFLCQYVLEAQIGPFRLRAAQPHLNAEELGDVEVILPPLDEQQDIVTYILSETQKIDSLIAAMRRTVELLKERRASLIAEAVTGKLDVQSSKETKLS